MQDKKILQVLTRMKNVNFKKRIGKKPRKYTYMKIVYYIHFTMNLVTCEALGGEAAPYRYGVAADYCD